MSAAPKLWVDDAPPMRMNERRIRAQRIEIDTPWGPAVVTRKSSSGDFWYVAMPGQHISGATTRAIVAASEVETAWQEKAPGVPWRKLARKLERASVRIAPSGLLGTQEARRDRAIRRCGLHGTLRCYGMKLRPCSVMAVGMQPPHPPACTTRCTTSDCRPAPRPPAAALPCVVDWVAEPTQPRVDCRHSTGLLSGKNAEAPFPGPPRLRQRLTPLWRRRLSARGWWGSGDLGQLHPLVPPQFAHL